ncbi:unnamed protein product [Nippostrongylus brasiliensis]|uniref:NCK-interacting protein with SH3 domain (inferred by orthology to a human protein) n=1 Tax=Nippostrongylus brasiliensis TaxID=27835 RepID=A0A0N4YYX1_NIPBR|nr:unnamed protein product [Nippostrongylus brasiliensis]
MIYSKYFLFQESSSLEGCPFGNKCFYKHQLPDGSIDPGEEPHARRKPHLADFFFSRDDAFARIQSAVQNYVISLKDCYDYRLLSEIKERTTRIFNEKVEDQNDLVRYQGLCCIKSLVNACPSLIPFLLNSRLPEVLALQFQTQSASLSNIHLTAIKLLAIIYSTNREPPLSHFGELTDIQ